MSKDVRVDTIGRVMGIDPSTRNMGVTVIDVDLFVSRPFELMYGNTIYGDKCLYDIPAQFDDQEETGVAARSFGLARSLGFLIGLYQPDWIICEDNYLQVNPGTFKQLIQFVSLVTEQCRLHRKYVSYVLPNLAKGIVGANFKGTQKEDVRAGLLKYNWLNPGKVELALLDEHSVDAGVVGLWGAEQLAKRYGVYPNTGVTQSG